MFSLAMLLSPITQFNLDTICNSLLRNETSDVTFDLDIEVLSENPKHYKIDIENIADNNSMIAGKYFDLTYVQYTTHYEESIGRITVWCRLQQAIRQTLAAVLIESSILPKFISGEYKSCGIRIRCEDEIHISIIAIRPVENRLWSISIPISNKK